MINISNISKVQNCNLDFNGFFHSLAFFHLL
jgi:hypothetical protein